MFIVNFENKKELEETLKTLVEYHWLITEPPEIEIKNLRLVCDYDFTPICWCDNSMLIQQYGEALIGGDDNNYFGAFPYLDGVITDAEYLSKSGNICFEYWYKERKTPVL